MSGLRFDVVAFVGGNRINLLGSAAEVVCLFRLIEEFAAPFLDEKERLIVLDRLFKRYLTIAETPIAIDAMKTVQERFAAISIFDINWEKFGFDKQPKLFDTTTGSLRESTEDCFGRFYQCASSVLYMHNVENRILRPVKLSRSDFGSLYEADQRPLEEYDALVGPPFWLAKN
jgi:hypothetical protein